MYFFSYVYTRIHAIFILGLFFLFVCAESPAGSQEGVACGNRTRDALTAVHQQIQAKFKWIPFKKGWKKMSDKILFRGRRNRRNSWIVPAEFRLFRGTENSLNSVPIHSEPWLAACIALRVVGAVLVIFLRRWRTICTVLQPMGSMGW